MPPANPHEKFEREMLDLVKRQTDLMAEMTKALQLQARALDSIERTLNRVGNRIGSV